MFIYNFCFSIADSKIYTFMIVFSTTISTIVVDKIVVLHRSFKIGMIVFTGNHKYLQTRTDLYIVSAWNVHHTLVHVVTIVSVFSKIHFLAVHVARLHTDCFANLSEELRKFFEPPFFALFLAAENSQRRCRSRSFRVFFSGN